MREETAYEGTVENIIFQNVENGYTVFTITPDGYHPEEEGEITCTAYMAGIAEGQHINLTGQYVNHPSYGWQFQVTAYEASVPSTKAAIEKYLGSGFIKGIGPKTAAKIVELFGEQSLMVIEEYPERLAQIRGITLAKARSISAVFHEQYHSRQVIMRLQELGVTPSYAMKIYNHYKERTLEVIQHNPYILSEDIFGIGFKMADKLAMNLGMAFDSPFRVRAGILYVLSLGAANGHVYLPREDLLRQAGELLEVHEDLMGHVLMDMQMEHALWQEMIDGCPCVFQGNMYYAECFVAKKILELAAFPFEEEEDADGELFAFQEKNSISLADKQQQAVKEVLRNGVLIITGGPGTGKTTTVNTILSLLESKGYEVELCAPTGRAAKRLSETTGREAKTIHRLLEVNYIAENSRNRFGFNRDDDKPLEVDAVIVDESSMIDLLLMQGLLKSIKEGAKLILVGDVDQLPAVGPGSVLKDLIESQKLKVVRLPEIFRQAQESAIVMNAHRINKGQNPVLNEKNNDFFFIHQNTQEGTIHTVVDLVKRRLPGFLRSSYLGDIQVLTPMRKSDLGCNHLNMVLQQHLNPPGKGKKEKNRGGVIFREGDKVMQIKNNYNLSWIVPGVRGGIVGEGAGVFNGDIGFIQKIDEEEETVRVLFDDNRQVDYDYSNLDELELSYAITVHKSQGSEYRAVVIPVFGGSPVLLSRNLLYTAVTRAKELVVLVGSMDTMARMVANDRQVRRYTSLCHRIIKLAEHLEPGEGV